MASESAADAPGPEAAAAEALGYLRSTGVRRTTMRTAPGAAAVVRRGWIRMRRAEAIIDEVRRLVRSCRAIVVAQ